MKGFTHTQYRLIAIGLILVGVALALAGCASSHQSSPDPGGQQGTRYAVLQNPSGFRNVAFQCYGHNGVYTTSHGTDAYVNLPSSVFVLANDEHCR